MSKTKEEKKQNRDKLYQELAFTDNFMFCKIMEKNHELCRQMLEIILDKKISKVVFVEKEDTIDITLYGKSIRLDIYLNDEEGTIYNVEMQTSHHKNLPKRARYYQGMIDLNSIDKGADYSQLRKSIVIFICTFDFFQEGLPVYTFTNRCIELPELELGDETSKIFINAEGRRDGLSEDMKAFLDYLKGKMPVQNDFIGKLQKEVDAARSREEWRVEYMTLAMELRERFHDGYLEGREEGREEGLEKGREAGRDEVIGTLIATYQELEVPKETAMKKLMEKLKMDKETAEEIVEKYWK